MNNDKNPFLLGFVDTNGNARDVFVGSDLDLIYEADYTKGLQIYKQKNKISSLSN